ncbi:MAG: hypothetical protein Nkreftii_003597 [Candidatus Nitrospira kreftii]|jgi:DNA-binding protein Fis|uniref:DNA binding HTH domain-containing protein n=1 Tax=Candidatus Nitrospira kreftii TaxID=2652173 RepID=A0A7S8J138_9BACT|nr:MAG: hypothetical protein Nkreftii_003597 [Candidatus Nitrospira kreftii]
MPVPSSAYTILLFTSDEVVQGQARQVFKDASLTLSRDATAFRKELSQQDFDIVIVESRSGQEQFNGVHDHPGLSRALLVNGSRAVLRKTLKILQLQLMSSPNVLHQNKSRDGSLENYLEAKMGEFVKSMRNGSAKNLHPILISAVERPLITSALKETRGNQIQAAELLGLNRNTLRKKIIDLHIPLKQTKVKASRGA